MHKSTLVKYCRNLKRKEMTRFLSFLKSPYFNKHKNVIALGEYLNEQYPDFPAEKIDRKAVHKAVFPEEEFDYGKLRHLFSYTLKLLEENRAIELFNSDPVQPKLMLLKDLRNRNLNVRFESFYKKNEEEIENYPHRNDDFYHYHYLNTKEGERYLKKNGIQYSEDQSLQKKVDNLDRFYLTEKLKNACEMLNREKVLDTKYKHHMINGLLAYIQSNLEEYQNSPAVLIYFYLYKLVERPQDEGNYYQVLDIIDEYEALFPVSELQIIWDQILVYCIRRVNEGKEDFRTELFGIYKKLLDKDILIKDGNFPAKTYTNIVSAALKLEEFHWCLHFIDYYKDQLHPDLERATYHYNLAYYHFEGGQFNSVLGFLNEAYYKGGILEYPALALKTKTYFELDMSEAFLGSMQEIKSREEQMKTQNGNGRFAHFFDFANRLFLLKKLKAQRAPEWVQEELQKLETEMQNVGRLPNEAWLRSKMELVGSGLKLIF